MRTIAVVNQKGGCGKTITAINLSACLAEGRRKTLLIDMDPQGHASLGLNVRPEDVRKSIYHVLSENHWDVGMSDIIIGLDKNLHLAPSGIILSAVEQELAGQPGREDRLLNALAEMPAEFDYVIVDCPPSLGLLTFNALRACREILVPVEISFFALHGLGKLSETIQLMENRFGQKKYVQALATIYDRRTRLAGEVLEELHDHFDENLCKTIIGINVRLKEATGFGQPICQYDRSCSGYRDYAALAKEVHSLASSRAYHLRSKPAMAAQLGPEVLKDSVRFSLHAPQAKTVQVAGDFNDWQPTDVALMRADGQGGWTRTLRLKPGIYQYRFVVDGQWMEDPANPNKVESPFGGLNSIIDYSKQKKS